MGAFNAPRATLAALAVGGVAAFASGLACTGSGSGRSSEQGAAGTVYVIDSTAKMFAFSEKGASQGSVALPSPMGALNGGGIGLASGELYVTIGQPTDAIRAYSLALEPAKLSAGAFAPLAVPRGIAYNPQDDRFYVGNGAAGGAPVFSASGAKATVSGSFPGSYGMSGIAYDPDDDTIWVANYVGAPSATPPMYGVSEYTASGDAAQTFDYGVQFAPPSSIEEPYAITVCPRSATGGTTLVVVGFTGVEKTGTPSVQPFTTSGAPVGPALTGDFAGVYALSCDASGNVYVADKRGLFRNGLTSGGFAGHGAALVSPGFFGLTPPIYGVLASSGLGGGASDAGGADGGPADGTVNDGAGTDGPIEGTDGGEEGGEKEAGARDGGEDAPSEGSSEGGDAGSCTPEPACTTNPTTAGWDGGAVTISSGKECTLKPNVTADKVLRASECMVYSAPDGLLVSGSADPVLSIEKGVTIALGAEMNLAVGGSGGSGRLVVNGTPCEPVVLTSAAASPMPGDWGMAQLDYPVGASTISNLIVQYSGSAEDSAPNTDAIAGLLLNGATGDFTVELNNVTTSNNGASGIAFVGVHTGPSPESCGTLTVTDWPATWPPSHPVGPFSVDYDAAGKLSGAQPPRPPSVRLSTGGAPGGYVHLYMSIADPNGIVDITQTWPLIAPLMYEAALPGDPTEAMTVGSTTGKAAILTIAAGNTLRLGPGFYMEVDPAGNGSALQANGAPGRPIVFTSLSGLPEPGEWCGVNLFYPGSESSSITYATLDSVGNGYIYNGCVNPLGYSPSGAIGVFGTPNEAPGCIPDPGPTFSNLTFTNLGTGQSAAGSFAIISDDVTRAMANRFSAGITSAPRGVFICPKNEECQ